MAHIWLRDSSLQWAARPLEGSDANLRALVAGAPENSPTADRVPAEAFLVHADSNSPTDWVLLAGQECGIAVNGLPLSLGIRVLADRDDIRWDPDGSAFYSAEELAAVVPLPEGDRKLFCPRCKQEITPGTPAVRCPRCGIWHHQSEPLPCYTYAPQCATCARKTSLNTGYDWTPEEM
jgi:hypothetical protein